MGDSDEEYDRRRGRDKFRRERSDYQERGGKGDERNRREEWTDNRREQWGKDRNRRDYREYDPRSRYSPVRQEEGQPAKRMRRDWDDQGYSGYEGRGGFHSQRWGNPPSANTYSRVDEGVTMAAPTDSATGIAPSPTQPPMMSFKQFLATQDDSISDEDAVKKFSEYKINFKKLQLKEFFTSHREEEWFRCKYHPEDYGKRKQEQQEARAKRMRVFMDLQGTAYMQKVNVDIDNNEDLLRLLDAVVIKLEGGDEDDLKFLNKSSEDENHTDTSTENQSKDDELKHPHQQESQSGEQSKISTVKEELQSKARQLSEQERTGDGINEDGTVGGQKRKREYDNNENEESGSESEAPTSEMDEDKSKSDCNDKLTKTIKQKEQNGEISELEEGETGPDEEIEEKEKNTDKTGLDDDTEIEKIQPKKRVLPQTSSIYLRQLAPSITKAEVEAMCRKFPGYLRVAIADPQPENRFFRRGWVSFERNVNIKEICWNFNSLRLRDCELGATVNRDLTMRIHPGSHLASHKQVVRTDIKLAVKIIQNFDSRHGLWADEEEPQTKQPTFGIVSKNPLLHNITDYMVEEASAEEEELLGKSNESNSNKNGEEITIEKDDTLLQVLDKLLLYLRIVHSVDYYNHNEYPNEDEMPNRCGIMHARKKPDADKVLRQEVDEYVSSFERKVQPLLQPLSQLSEADCVKLGKKEVNTEVENFIKLNTTELGKDKFLCPLSGKKFQGADYVRKHILNKHGERVDEVKRDVEYFNNYLRDPRRPQLPDHPGRKPPPTPVASIPESNNPISGTQNQPGHYSGNYRGNHNQGFTNYGERNFNRGGGNFNNRRGGGGGRGGVTGGGKEVSGPQDPRELISYCDLDAPEVNEVF